VLIARTTFRWVLVILTLILIIYFFWVVRKGLYPFIIAFFLAYLLNPAVNWIENKGHMRRCWAILLAYLVVFSIIILGGSYLLPLIIRELEGFADELPKITVKVEELINDFQWQYQNSTLPYSLRIALDNNLTTLEGEVHNFIDALIATILGTLTHIIGIAVSPILAFYLLHDWNEIEECLLYLLPGNWRQELCTIFRDIDKVLSGIIRGQLMIAVIVGILVSSGLYFLGVRYAIVIGILAGIFDVIPYFGAIIGATPALTVALLDSSILATKVAVLFLIIHQIEGTIIGPKILGDKTGLNPLIVILVLFIGEEYSGVIGMLLAVPIVAIGKVIIRHLAKNLI